jgi:hypothetical protein
MIQIMFYKVGIRLWSTHALGFMLPAIMTTVLSECRFTYSPLYIIIQLDVFYISSLCFSSFAVILEMLHYQVP